LDYTFESDAGFQNYRVLLSVDSPRVPSITPAYWCAFLYENEIHDLFGIEIDGLAVDFKGNLYKTTVKYALGQACTRKAPPAAAPSTAKPAVTEAAPSATNPQG
jgi:ech hydrogenase subunit D